MASSVDTTVESSRRKTYSAPALEKGLDILELLSAETDGLNVSEISKRLDRSVGELFRMLVVLEQRGYVALPAGSDRYSLTLQLFTLAHRFPPVKRLTKIAGPILQKLSYEIEQSCHLVIYYEGKGHVVVQQDSPSARVFSVRLGAEAPMLDTCSGHILLAFTEQEQRQRILRRIPDYSSQRFKDVEAIVERVSAQGYEIIESAQAQGVQDIGYPVFDYTENIVAAMVVPFLSYLDGSHPVKIDDALVHLRDAATRLSESLGYISD